MVQITSLWVIAGIAIVGAQYSDHQEGNQHSPNQVTPAIDPHNPWALYPHPYYTQYHHVDRQGVLNNPENVAIGAVAVGGAIGLGALALGIADTRQNINRVSDRQNQICSDNRAIATQLDALVQAIISTISVAAVVAAAPPAAETPERRQAPPIMQIEQTFNSIRSGIPTINC